MATIPFIITNAVLTIGLQAKFTKLRHYIMMAGATIAVLLTTAGNADLNLFLGSIPLDVMLILLCLTLYGDLIIDSQVFSVLIRKLAKVCQGKGAKILIIFNLITFLVSALMNNYQALILLLPPMFHLLSQLGRLNKRFMIILLGSLIVSSNLGGAASPIGDFPALVMLAKGEITFSSYLQMATPMALIAITLVIIVSLLFYKTKPLPSDPQEEQMSVEFTQQLYRNIQIDWRILLPAVLVFIGMMVFWVLGYNPAKVTVAGFCLLALAIKTGRSAEYKIKQLDSSIFIYYLCLLLLIASVEQTGILSQVPAYLETFRYSPSLYIIVFSAITMLVTGLVSAGPATIVLLPVVQEIAGQYPPFFVITCFALSICAGSSMFLTSATAGPLVSAVAEKYSLTIEGKAMEFGMKDYLIPGLIGACIIFSVNLLFICLYL